MLGLVHKFGYGDMKLALDVNSGFIFSIDDLIWDLLDFGNSTSIEEVVEKLSGKYPLDEIQEGFSEIEKLKLEGKLFSSFDKNGTVFAEPVVKAMCLFASGVCNLKCKYCFLYEDTPKSNQDSLLDTDVGKKALDFLVRKSGTRTNLEVDFFGGEPLLNFDVVKEVVKYGRSIEKDTKKRFKFTITTNGLLLNDDVIDFINAEFENVVISIDGRPTVHDAMRRKLNDESSYESILTNALNFVEKRGNASYYIRGTFTRHNLDFDKDVIHLVERGFKHISIEPVVLVQETEYSLKDDDLLSIDEAYRRLLGEYLDRKSKGDEFHYFHFQVDLDNGPCVAKRITGCGAGNEYVAVTPNGDIYPCHQFAGDKDFLMGNVLQDNFNTSLQNKFGQNNVNSKEECENCWAKFFCGGGCPANSFHFNNDISKPYALGCAIEKNRLEYALILNTIEKIEKNAEEV